MRSNGHTPHPSSTSNSDQTDPDFSAMLPHADSAPPGFVALNSKGERLDVYIPPVTAGTRNRFAQRIANKKLCNKFHLAGDCPDLDCPFDHSPIDEDLHNYLRSIAAATPCTRRSTCKNLTCLNGHVCQKPDCKYRGGKSFCRLPGPMHCVQLQFKEWVPGVSPPQGKRERTPSRNASGSPSPPPRRDYDIPLKSPTSSANVTKSFFGLNRGVSEDISVLAAAESEDEELAGKAGAKLSLDSDLD